MNSLARVSDSNCYHHLVAAKIVSVKITATKMPRKCFCVRCANAEVVCSKAELPTHAQVRLVGSQVLTACLSTTK